MDEQAIWTLGDEITPDRPVYGRGEFLAKTAIDEEPRVDLDDDPPGHANLIDWPTKKEAQKKISQALAAAASLHLK